MDKPASCQLVSGQYKKHIVGFGGVDSCRDNKNAPSGAIPRWCGALLKPIKQLAVERVFCALVVGLCACKGAVHVHTHLYL